MRDDAVVAVVGADVATTIISRSAFVRPPGLHHQRVVVREERAELVGPVRRGEEDVRDEAGLLLHLEDAGADVVGQPASSGTGKRLTVFMAPV